MGMGGKVRCEWTCGGRRTGAVLVDPRGDLELEPGEAKGIEAIPAHGLELNVRDPNLRNRTVN